MFRFGEEQPPCGQYAGQVHGQHKPDGEGRHQCEQQHRHKDCQAKADIAQTAGMFARHHMHHLLEQVIVARMGHLEGPDRAVRKPGGCVHAGLGLAHPVVAAQPVGRQCRACRQEQADGIRAAPGEHGPAREGEDHEKERCPARVPARDRFELRVDHRRGQNSQDAQHNRQCNGRPRQAARGDCEAHKWCDCQCQHGQPRFAAEPGTARLREGPPSIFRVLQMRR